MTTLALIGVGKWGQNYLKTADQLANIQIKYICARSYHSLVPFSNVYQKVTSIDNLLQKDDIEGFIIATPSHTHYDIAKKLLVNKRNLLVEKPLALKISQAQELVSIWRNNQNVGMVGHIQLFNPAYLKMKQLLKKIRPLKKVVFKGLGSPPRKDTSVLWDWGPHPISIILDLIQQPVSKIVSYPKITVPNGKLVDALTIDIFIGNHLRGQIEISWYYPEKTRLIIFEGEKGKITFDDTKLNEKLVLEINGKNPEFPQYSGDSPLAVELKSFVQAIKTKSHVISDLNFGLKVVNLLSSIESTFNGQVLANHNKM